MPFFLPSNGVSALLQIAITNTITITKALQPFELQGCLFLLLMPLLTHISKSYLAPRYYTCKKVAIMIINKLNRRIIL